MFVREAIQRYPQLKTHVVDKLLEVFPHIKSAKSVWRGHRSCGTVGVMWHSGGHRSLWVCRVIFHVGLLGS